MENRPVHTHTLRSV